MQIRYLVSRWGSDVNSLGSYSYAKVANPHDIFDKLRMHVHNLFFAGEATSADYPGSVHGAYSSGVMAAQDCRTRLLKHFEELDLFHPVVGEDAFASMPLLISRVLVNKKIETESLIKCLNLLDIFQMNIECHITTFHIVWYIFKS